MQLNSSKNETVSTSLKINLEGLREVPILVLESFNLVWKSIDNLKHVIKNAQESRT